MLYEEIQRNDRLLISFLQYLLSFVCIFRTCKNACQQCTSYYLFIFLLFCYFFISFLIAFVNYVNQYGSRISHLFFLLLLFLFEMQYFSHLILFLSLSLFLLFSFFFIFTSEIYYKFLYPPSRRRFLNSFLLAAATFVNVYSF